MIVLREFKKEDLEKLRTMLQSEDIKVELPSSSELIYMSISDDELMGAIKVNENEDIWTLDYIYIAEKWRNQMIGDGLLRVMIDKLDRNKVKSLYFKDIDQYLIKRGFEKNDDNILELDVENFFGDTCSCCDGCEV